MIDGINGAGTSAAAGPLVNNLVQSTPPSGSPAGAPVVEPDVEVALSDLAAARLQAMQSRGPESSEEVSWDASSGSLNHGVDKGGFDWSLDVTEGSTNEGMAFKGDEAWANTDQVVNGVLVDEANAANRVALGDTSLKPNS